MFKISINDRQTNHVEKKEGKVFLDNHKVSKDLIQVDTNTYHLVYNGKSYRIQTSNFDPTEKRGGLYVNGNYYELSASDKYDQLLKDLGIERMGGKKAEPIKSPMPGLVIKVNVSEGDEVKEGDQLVILEAMKMENVIKAPADATVKKVTVNENDSVEKGEVLVEF